MPQGPPSAFELLHFKEDSRLRAECPPPPGPMGPQAQWVEGSEGQHRSGTDSGIEVVHGC